jgi:hypothetical protein
LCDILLKVCAEGDVGGVRFFPIAIASAAIVLGADAFAQSADGDMPFGLSKFRWQMTSADTSAEIELLSVAERAPTSSPTTDQNVAFAGPYKWQDCTFDMSFYFAKDKLDRILLDTRVGQPQCADEILKELAGRFGAGVRKGDEQFEHREWHTKATTIIYNKIGPPEVDLIQVGGAPLTIYDMVAPLRPSDRKSS